MSQSQHSGERGYTAVAALGNGVCVKLNAAKNLVVATAATDRIIGTTYGAALAGDVATVRLRNASGTSKVKLGGTVAVGDPVTSSATGTLVTATAAIAGAVPAAEVVGYALEAGVVGDEVEILNALCRI